MEMQKPGVVRELLGANGSWAAGHRSGLRTGLGGAKVWVCVSPPKKAISLGGRGCHQGEEGSGVSEEELAVKALH